MLRHQQAMTGQFVKTMVVEQQKQKDMDGYGQ